jgi:hypothetical protein
MTYDPRISPWRLSISDAGIQIIFVPTDPQTSNSWWQPASTRRETITRLCDRIGAPEEFREHAIATLAAMGYAT